MTGHDLNRWDAAEAALYASGARFTNVGFNRPVSAAPLPMC